MDEQQLFILIGELKNGQAAVKGAVEDLTVSTNSLQKTINELPCATNSRNIELLVDWKTQCNGTNQATKLEQIKGTIGLKNGLILIVLTAVVTGLATKLLDLLAR